MAEPGAAPVAPVGTVARNGAVVSLRGLVARVFATETWVLAQELGGDALVDLIVEETHTCYKGERGLRHDWGYGCGACPACELRAKGYAEWQASRADTATPRVKRQQN